MEKNYVKKQKGITLVALVVTIVALLILAGVSLNMVLGENGIVVKAKEALVKSDNATVSDSIKMLVASYIADDQGRGEVDTIEKLREAGIIDNNNIVNVPTLVERKLGTGNGSNKNDVYVIEDNTLYYYNKNKEKTDLGEIDNNEKQNDKSYRFTISDDGTIDLVNRRDYYGYPDGAIPEETVVIPSMINGIKVTKIADEMFLSIGVKNVVLPEGITSIGSGAFKNSRLQSINIPNTVTGIGASAFWGCDITQIDIPSSITQISYYTFYNCDKLVTVNIPADSRIEYIWQNAFTWCSSLVELNFPNTLKEIGMYAFSGCTNLKKISGLDNVEFMEEEGLDSTEWFYDLKNNSPDGPIYIGKVLYAYKGEMPLNTSIVVKDGTGTIAKEAFYNCENLVSITIPKGIILICENAFDGCTNLKTINYTGTKADWNKIYKRSQGTTSFGNNINYEYTGE